MVPYLVEVFDGESRQLSSDGADYREEDEVHPMGDEVMVPEFHILELHRLQKVREFLGSRKPSRRWF